MKSVKLIALLACSILSLSLNAQTKAGRKDSTTHATYYSCSMHPEVKMTSPGKCPKCGMTLVASKKEEMKMNEIKTYSCPVHVAVTSNHPGKCPKCGKQLTGSLKEQMKAGEVKLYTCPMHPEIALKSDGTCPKCGAQLVEKKAETQHH